MWFQKPPLGTPLDWGNPLNKGTAMAFAMNEGHGNHLQDLSLNGNHGTLHNFAFPPTSMSGWNPGQNGIGLNFDETDDYIDCGNNDSLNTTEIFMISAIINPRSLVDNKFIYTKGTKIFFRTEGDELTLGLDIGTVKYAKSSGVNFVAGNYYHVVGMYDKYDGTNLIRLFVNGNEVSYAQQDNTGGGSIESTVLSGLVGKRSDGFVFPGYIDQVRVQSSTWSAKEVRDYAINPWQVYLDE